MRFARVVFLIAGIWGLVIVIPLYFMDDVVGRTYPPALTHPDFYYGFAGVTLVWQFAFFLIAFPDPVRFRPLMVIATLEKGVYVVTLTVLYLMHRLQFGQFAVVVPDGILALLFVIAFVKS